MFLGEYRHTLDSKKRTFLPSKLREKLGSEVVIARGVDKCLTLYTMEGWKKFEEKIEELPPIRARSVRRWLYGFSGEVTIDSQGRIAIPKHLVEYAELAGKKSEDEKEEKGSAVYNIVSVGVGDHIEIWSEQEYENMINTMSAEQVAAALTELGM